MELGTSTVRHTLAERHRMRPGKGVWCAILRWEGRLAREYLPVTTGLTYDITPRPGMVIEAGADLYLGTPPRLAEKRREYALIEPDGRVTYMSEAGAIAYLAGGGTVPASGPEARAVTLAASVTMAISPGALPEVMRRPDRLAVTIAGLRALADTLAAIGPAVPAPTVAPLPAPVTPPAPVVPAAPPAPEVRPSRVVPREAPAPAAASRTSAGIDGSFSSDRIARIRAARARVSDGNSPNQGGVSDGNSEVAAVAARVAGLELD